MRARAALLSAFCAAAAAGCGPARSIPVSSRPRTPVTFRDVSAESGISFQHRSGARGKKYMPETVGSGCAFLDYDGDGRLDLFYINSTDWPGPGAASHYPALYRNKGDGTFQDVTRAAGLALNVYGMGACVADYDNDGDADLFLTCIGPNHLFRNDGRGRFRDVTAEAGVAGRPVEPGGLKWKWSSSAAWVDYDRDGLLDLFVENYVKWTPATDPFCGVPGQKAYCAPNSFEGVASLLYRNLGAGRFQDVSDRTGIAEHVGKSFGIAVSDYNHDGWPDLAVSNDTKENFLFINREGRGFEERGLEAGIAVSPGGTARAGMGIDAADWRNDGTFGLVIGNFSREGLALYQGPAAGQGNQFREVSYPANIGETSLLSLTFGVFFFDFDLDGRQDIFAANGHIDDFVHTRDSMVRYEQPPLLYRGERENRFTEVTSQSGPAMTARRVLRGCAHGDVDDDGDPDVAVVWNNRRGELWRNEGGSGARWIGLRLRGTKSNRDGIGALVRVTAGGTTQSAYRHSGGSFLSDHDPRLVFGLGGAARADKIAVEWPSGQAAEFTNVEQGRYYDLVEGAAQLQRSEPGSVTP